MNENVNPFANTVAHYSDSRLETIAKSPEKYAPKLVDAAIHERSIRGNSENNTNRISYTQKDNHLTVVRQNLGFGASIEDCETFLLNEGLSKEEALIILDKAVELGPLKKEIRQNTKKEDSGMSAWAIIITVLLVIKLIYRLAS